MPATLLAAGFVAIAPGGTATGTATRETGAGLTVLARAFLGRTGQAFALGGTAVPDLGRLAGMATGADRLGLRRLSLQGTAERFQTTDNLT